MTELAGTSSIAHLVWVSSRWTLFAGVVGRPATSQDTARHELDACQNTL